MRKKRNKYRLLISTYKYIICTFMDICEILVKYVSYKRIIDKITTTCVNLYVDLHNIHVSNYLLRKC